MSPKELILTYLDPLGLIGCASDVSMEDFLLSS